MGCYVEMQVFEFCSFVHFWGYPSRVAADYEVWSKGDLVGGEESNISYMGPHQLKKNVS